MTPRLPLEQRCGIGRSLETLGERWAILIVREAFFGRTRFSEFRASLAVSPDVLTARLSSLVEAGILSRSSYRDEGAREREEYLLTDAGRALAPLLGTLAEWGEAHLPDRNSLHMEYRDAASGELLQVGFVTKDGRMIDPTSVEMHRVTPADVGARPA